VTTFLVLSFVPQLRETKPSTTVLLDIFVLKINVGWIPILPDAILRFGRSAVRL